MSRFELAACHKAGKNVLVSLLIAALVLTAVPTKALAELEDALDASSSAAALLTEQDAESASAADESQPLASSDTSASSTVSEDASAPIDEPSKELSLEASPEARSVSECSGAPAAQASEATPSCAEETQAHSIEGDGSSDLPMQAASTDFAASAQDTSTQVVNITVRVLGPDATGSLAAWANDLRVTVPSDYNAWEATVAAFGKQGISYAASESSWGIYLESITSPFTGTALAATSDWSQYWQFFVGNAPSDTGASSTALTNGDVLTWYYGPYTATLPQVDAHDGRITASLTVIGIDEAGKAQTWLSSTARRLEQGATVADLTESVASTGSLTITYNPASSWGWELTSITSPFDASRTLATDPNTWQYWQLFVNGVSSELGAGSAVLSDGDAVTWYYSLWGDALPSDGKAMVEIVSDATRPSYVADWAAPQKGNVDGGAALRAATPTAEVALAWAQDLRGEKRYVNCSDPVIVSGHIYLAVDNELRMLAAGDGSMLRSAQLASTVGINAPIVYADGIIIVALLDGRVQALTADTLTTVWLADPFNLSSYSVYDPAPSISVHASYAYVTHFGTLSAGGEATGGRMAAISLATGAVRWVVNNAVGAGYYTNGITFVEGIGVATDDAGRVFSFDLHTGRELDAYVLGDNSTVRSAPVADAKGHVYVCAYDGSLHRLSVDADGALSAHAAARVGDSSISAPTIVNDQVYVGAGSGAAGLIAVLNAETLAPIARVEIASASGSAMRVQCAPLVSVTDEGTFAYVTTFAAPGCLYRYRLGDDAAHLLFTPPETLADYCFYPVVADAQGALYYTNDAYSLFKLVGAATDEPGHGSGEAGEQDSHSNGGQEQPGGDAQGSGAKDESHTNSGASNTSGQGRSAGNRLASSSQASLAATRLSSARPATNSRSLSQATTAANSRSATTKQKDRPADAAQSGALDAAESSSRKHGGRSKAEAENSEKMTTAASDADAGAVIETTGAVGVNGVPPLAIAGIIGGAISSILLIWWLRRQLSEKRR